MPKDYEKAARRIQELDPEAAKLLAELMRSKAHYMKGIKWAVIEILEGDR